MSTSNLTKEASKLSGLLGRLPGAAHVNSKNLKEALTSAGILALTGGIVGAGANLAVGAERGMVGAIKKHVGYRDMLKRNPELAKEQSGDVKSYYDTLHTLSPTMASDPNISGAFVKRQLEYRDMGVQPTDAAVILKAESDAAKANTPRSVFGDPLGIGGSIFGRRDPLGVLNAYYPSTDGGSQGS